MNQSQYSKLGAVFTLLLGLHGLWPPVTSWWPPQRLFWPLILIAGALALLVPQKLPPVLQRIAARADFGALFTAVVWAQLWLNSGVFWLLAALPLALAHWRGADWNWKWSELSPSQRGWFGAVAVALVMLRSTWISVSGRSAGMLMGGMHYGLNTFNYSTGYYEWGFQYSPAMSFFPGSSYEIPISGVELSYGVWAALGCWILLLRCVRRDEKSAPIGSKKALTGLLAALLMWWGWQLWRGNIAGWPAWIFAGAIGFLFYALVTQRPRVESSSPK